jgi:fused signal recognition particle receptor
VSYLVTNVPAQGLAGGWDIFGKKAKEKRKLQLGLQAQSFQEKMSLKRYEQEKAAVETFRDKTSAKLAEVETAAVEATSAMEKARKLAVKPELRGDPILDEFQERVAQLEQAIVQVQTGTVVDTATFDTHRLAISYSDAQAALIAMRSIGNRAVELVTLLKDRLREISAEQIRAKKLRQQQALLAQQEAKRQAELRREQELKRRDAALKAKEEAERRAASELRRLDNELRNERRALQRAKTQLTDHKRRMAEEAAREESRAIRKREVSALRSSFRSRRASLARTR